MNAKSFITKIKSIRHIRIIIGWRSMTPRQLFPLINFPLTDPPKILNSEHETSFQLKMVPHSSTCTKWLDMQKCGVSAKTDIGMLAWTI